MEEERNQSRLGKDYPRTSRKCLSLPQRNQNLKHSFSAKGDRTQLQGGPRKEKTSRFRLRAFYFDSQTSSFDRVQEPTKADLLWGLIISLPGPASLTVLIFAWTSSHSLCYVPEPQPQLVFKLKRKSSKVHLLSLRDGSYLGVSQSEVTKPSVVSSLSVSWSVAKEREEPFSCKAQCGDEERTGPISLTPCEIFGSCGPVWMMLILAFFLHHPTGPQSFS